MMKDKISSSAIETSTADPVRQQMSQFATKKMETDKGFQAGM